MKRDRPWGHDDDRNVKQPKVEGFPADKSSRKYHSVNWNNTQVAPKKPGTKRAEPILPPGQAEGFQSLEAQTGYQDYYGQSAYYYPPAPGAYNVPYGNQPDYNYQYPNYYTTEVVQPPLPVVIDEKKKKEPKNLIKATRSAGGQEWHDPSLNDWAKDDHRIFVGNLGNEVSDEGLRRAFIQYKSISRAKVLRDKKTGKSRGYGFVSFLEPQDFIRALKEMQGKYICNRPCKLTKSRWKDRNIPAK